jgi:hypothetical protein
LIDHGADANIPTNDGILPIHQSQSHYLRCYPDLETCKILAPYTKNINAFDKNNNSPLSIAAHANKKDVVEFLIEMGAEVYIKNYLVGIPQLDSEIMKLLLLTCRDISAQINAKEKNEKTCLHIASENGHLENVKLLVEFGAKVNILDEKGKSSRRLVQDSKESYTSISMAIKPRQIEKIKKRSLDFDEIIQYLETKEIEEIVGPQIKFLRFVSSLKLEETGITALPNELQLSIIDLIYKLAKKEIVDRDGL